MQTDSNPSLKKKVRPGTTTHGMSRSPEYRSWDSMKGRCLNSSNRAFPYYGGRGITICQEWIDSFEAFYRDMGPRPTPKHTLERIDNDGNYEPTNCKWATRKEQSLNKRHWTSFTFNGETRSVTEWAKHLNVPYQVLYHRLLRYPPDEILSMRLQPTGRGEDSSRAFLKEIQVREMRRLHASGEANYSEIGRRFGVDRRYVRAIIMRRTWKHLV